MPWLSEATKDVISCDKPRVEANTHRDGDFRMGEPSASECITTHSVEQTRGTETSHYPEEKKTKVIPQVVASERGVAQTGVVTAISGVVGPPVTILEKIRRIRWK